MPRFRNERELRAACGKEFSETVKAKCKAEEPQCTPPPKLSCKAGTCSRCGGDLSTGHFCGSCGESTPELLHAIKKVWRKLPSGGNDANVAPHRKGDGNNDLNNTPTPPSICRWIYETVSPHVEAELILDPCAGAGNLTKPWRKSGSDAIEFEIQEGKDFFEQKGEIKCDLVLLNPPFELSFRTSHFDYL